MDFLKSEAHCCLKFGIVVIILKSIMVSKTAFICLKYNKNIFIVKY